jgi:hypothetical protein
MRTVLASACLTLWLAFAPRPNAALRVGAAARWPLRPAGTRLAKPGRWAPPAPPAVGAQPDEARTAKRCARRALRRAPELPMAVRGGGAEHNAVDLLRAATWNMVGKNTKWIVSLTAAAVLLYRRDALAVSAIAGALSNAVLGKMLKRVLKQKRPDGAPLADPGMPSSHAMSLFFLSGYLCAVTVAWTPAWQPAQRAAAMAALLSFATSSAAWRVASGLHTTPQIFVGALLGGVNGVLWFHITASHMEWLQSLDHMLAADRSIPAVLCGILIAGALVVGSVERKLGVLLRGLRPDGK